MPWRSVAENWSRPPWRELLYRVAVATACRIDPTPRIVSLRARRRPTPPSCLALVYTGRSPECARAIVADATAAHFDVRLWALRDVDPELAPLTLGSGLRSRLQLHNLLVGSPGGEWVVVSDDDVAFRRGTIVDLVRTAAMLGLDIAQPAHERGSHVSHLLTRRLPFHAARLTTFVECGPVVAFSPRVLPRVLPFPDYGMGWGVELLWHDLLAEGYRLGVVDSVSIIHLFEPATIYDKSAEKERLEMLLRDRGFSSLTDILTTTHRIMPWQSCPLSFVGAAGMRAGS